MWSIWVTQLGHMHVRNRTACVLTSNKKIVWRRRRKNSQDNFADAFHWQMRFPCNLYQSSLIILFIRMNVDSQSLVLMCSAISEHNVPALAWCVVTPPSSSHMSGWWRYTILSTCGSPCKAPVQYPSIRHMCTITSIFTRPLIHCFRCSPQKSVFMGWKSPTLNLKWSQTEPMTPEVRRFHQKEKKKKKCLQYSPSPS